MRITKEQRTLLMETHRASGLDASRALATLLGVSRNYGAQLCRVDGDKKPALRRDRNDPRWQRAIQRGAIIA